MYSINGVEIFSVGKWNGDNYTLEDLQEIVKAFEENSNFKPYLKLGHDSKQKLLQEDGLPAAGWINRIYVQGNKLVADFVDIPRKIYDLIKVKAYRKVSSEIFWNITIGEKKYKRMLAAVALLGADTPGVMNLKDILSMYKQLENNYEKIGSGDELDLKGFSIEGEKKMSKTEAEIKLELETQAQKDQIAALEAEKKDYASKQAQAEQELADLKKFKAEAEAREAAAKVEAEQAKIAKFVTDLKSEKLVTPAMECLVTELLGPDKKEYSHDKKSLSKQDAIKELLKLSKAAADVNFDESSSHDYAKDSDIPEKEMEKEIQKYMKDEKCSYAAAYKAVMKKNKQK